RRQLGRPAGSSPPDRGGRRHVPPTLRAGTDRRIAVGRASRRRGSPADRAVAPLSAVTTARAPAPTLPRENARAGAGHGEAASRVSGRGTSGDDHVVTRENGADRTRDDEAGGGGEDARELVRRPRAEGGFPRSRPTHPP